MRIRLLAFIRFGAVGAIPASRIMSKTRETRVQDIVTDKAMWLARVLQGHFGTEYDDEAKSELFHIVREHYGMLLGEVLGSILMEREDGRPTPRT